MLENIIIIGLVEYFFFYLLNHSLLFSLVKTKIDYYYNFYKIKGSPLRHFLYIPVCPVCFPFHLTWIIGLTYSFSQDFNNLFEIFIYICTVPVICLLLDNLTIFLAREN